MPSSDYAVYPLSGPMYTPASQVKKEVASGSLILIWDLSFREVAVSVEIYTIAHEAHSRPLMLTKLSSPSR